MLKGAVIRLLVGGITPSSRRTLPTRRLLTKIAGMAQRPGGEVVAVDNDVSVRVFRPTSTRTTQYSASRRAAASRTSPGIALGSVMSVLPPVAPTL